jgi:hypothetical protein
MILRRWESWGVYRRGGVKVGEVLLRRHFTRRAAQRWADEITNDPTVLSLTIGSALHPESGGRMLFVDADVRRRSVGTTGNVVPIRDEQAWMDERYS